MTLCFTLQFGISQKYRDKPGYLVNLTGDTLEGKIKIDRNYSDKVEFKERNKSDFSSYSATQIHSFYVEDHLYYQSVDISFDNEIRTLFLRQIVDGQVSIFQEKADSESNYVLIDQDGKKLYLSKNDRIENGNYIVDTDYVGLIKNFLKACPKTRSLKNIQYSKKEIAKVIMDYNECIKPNYKNNYLLKDEKIKVSVGPMIGLYSYDLRGSGIQAPFRYFESSGTIPMFGVTFSLSKGKFSLLTGINYMQFTSEFQHVFSITTIDIGHEVKFIEVPLTLKYRFTNKRVSPFVYGGIQIGKETSSMSSQYRVELGTVQIDEEYNTMYDHMIGTEVGVGLSIKTNFVKELMLSFGYCSKSFILSPSEDISTNGYTMKLTTLF